MEQQKPNKCFGSSKTRYPDIGEAKQAMVKLKATKRKYDLITGKRLNRRKGKVAQARIYFCPFCKGYHMTKDEVVMNRRSKREKYEDYLKRTAPVIKTKQEAEDWKKDCLPFPNTNQNQQL